jgi:tetratricopeptide (TPR) repeat protein
MMSERFKILVVIIAALVIGAILFPQAASAWFLNAANAQIARAATTDSSERAAALANADTQITQARQLANEPRLSLAQARAALARGDAAGVLATASPSLQSDPIAQFVWANAAWQARDVDTAFARWRDAGALVFFVNQTYRALDKHDWQDAEKFARIAIGIAPDYADTHFALGDALSRQDPANSEALRELERAEMLARDDEFRSTILSRRAEILAQQGKLRDALVLFDQARRVAPLDARPRTGYALAQLQLDPNARAAIALLTQVVTDSPWYTAAYGALAQIAEKEGDGAGAETWLKTGLAKNPNDPRLLFPLGELYARQGRTADARTTLRLALKLETRADAVRAISRALEKLRCD